MTDTAPYGTPSAPTRPPAWQSPPTPLSPPPRRGGLAASVVAASLVVGAGAGLGGAALWTSTHQTDTTQAAASSSAAPAVHQGEAPSTGSVEAVAAAVLPSVVKIDVAGTQGSGSGSGIILSADGTILTNHHVVELAADSGSLEVSFNDGTRTSATILGTDPLTDTAVIQAEDVSGLTPATIGRSDRLDVGQEVVAIGSPFGLESTVTSGIVSALNRPVNVGTDAQGNAATYPAIQTDAAINPGNSGGPLVDMNGDVIGINASIRTASSSAESGSIGLGFAISIDEVMPIVDQMTAGETPTHAKMGVSVGDATSGAVGAIAVGAEVRGVTAGSAAAEAGLQQGDVITRVDDRLISSADSLVATIRSYRPGDSVEVTWERDGKEQTGSITLDSDAVS